MDERAKPGGEKGGPVKEPPRGAALVRYFRLLLDWDAPPAIDNATVKDSAVGGRSGVSDAE